MIGLPVLAVANPSTSQLRVAGKPTAGLPPGTMWLAATSAVEPTMWRVNAVAELGAGQYQVTGTEYHVEKWTYVETGWLIPPPSFSLIPKGPLPAPTNITVQIATPDLDSFRRSESYLTGQIARAVARGQRSL